MKSTDKRKLNKQKIIKSKQSKKLAKSKQVIRNKKKQKTKTTTTTTTKSQKKKLMNPSYFYTSSSSFVSSHNGKIMNNLQKDIQIKNNQGYMITTNKGKKTKRKLTNQEINNFIERPVVYNNIKSKKNNNVLRIGNFVYM